MTEEEIKQRIQEARKLTMWSDEEFESDQMLKRPQPPLTKTPVSSEIMKLPRNFQDLKLENDFVKLLYLRRSNRVYTQEKMDLLTLSFLMWAQQGVKGIRGRNYATLRTVPSGGARHPFELYAVVLNVEGMEPGFYHYLPLNHEMEKLKSLDLNDKETMDQINASLCGQIWALKGNVIFFYSLVPYRGEWRYSFDAHRPMMMDAGHVTQNLYLACAAAGLGTCAIAAVDYRVGSKLFDLDGVEEYLFYSAPVGTISDKNEADEKAFYAFLEEE